MVIKMYEEYLEFVRNYLIEHKGLISENPSQTFRSRYEHTKRVIKWLDIITEGMDIDREALYMAAVFHDVGYEDKNKKEHGKRGAEVFRHFGTEHGYEPDFIEKVANMIELHSDKHLLGTDIPLELTLLMEADQMDEEGTMRVLWDCLVTGKLGADSYRDAYDRMIEYKNDMPNAMVTPRAREIWERKSRLYREFLSQLEGDLFIDDETNIYRKIAERGQEK